MIVTTARSLVNAGRTSKNVLIAEHIQSVIHQAGPQWQVKILVHLSECKKAIDHAIWRKPTCQTSLVQA